MEDGQGLSATWSAHSDRPHQSGEGCDLSLTEGQESPRHAFPQELSHLNGPNFLGGQRLAFFFPTPHGTLG